MKRDTLLTIKLPTAAGRMEDYAVREPKEFVRPKRPFTRQALAASAKSPEDYASVYDRILSQVREPVIIHWLGEMFDPALNGYWGAADHTIAMRTALDIVNAHAAKVDGVKISL